MMDAKTRAGGDHLLGSASYDIQDVSPAKCNFYLMQSVAPKQSEVQKVCSIVFISAL